MNGPILVASDGTQGSAGAIRTGMDMAREGDRELRVLTVVEPFPIYGFGDATAVPQGYPLLQYSLAEDRKSAVGRQLDDLDPSGDWPVEVEIGPVALTIVDHARRIGAEMILLGSGPNNPIDRWLRSETALRVIHLSHVPVLVVPPTASGQRPSSALAAVDFGEFSLRAADAVHSVLGEDGHLHLVHVVWAANEAEALPSLAEYRNTYTIGATARLEQLAAELSRSTGLRVDAAVVSGDPAQEIVSLANRLNVDVIAAGSHGYGFLGRILMGSVSTRVIRGARCSVLVVPSESVPEEVHSFGEERERARLVGIG